MSAPGHPHSAPLPRETLWTPLASLCGMLAITCVLCALLLWEFVRALWRTAILGKSAAEQMEDDR